MRYHETITFFKTPDSENHCRSTAHKNTYHPESYLFTRMQFPFVRNKTRAFVSKPFFPSSDKTSCNFYCRRSHCCFISIILIICYPSIFYLEVLQNNFSHPNSWIVSRVAHKVSRPIPLHSPPSLRQSK